MKFAELEAKTDAQADRFEKAKEQADDEVRRIQGQTKIILAAKVSPDCGKAIEWGIEQAHAFT
jgi:hypothetical protein